MVNPQHEPTMEEILASIRKIISDDASAASATLAASPPEPGAAEPEVLELTQEVGGPAPVVHAAVPPAIESEPAETHPTPKSEVAVESPSEATPTPQPEEGIFSEKTRQKLSDALASIGPEAAQPAPEPHVETGAEAPAVMAGETIETVFARAVKEAFDPVFQKWLADNRDALVARMKPEIRDWLDENFPALLEDAIRSELARAKPRVRR
jgi:cell pole-organizing protein PopZ